MSSGGTKPTGLPGYHLVEVSTTDVIFVQLSDGDKWQLGAKLPRSDYDRVFIVLLSRLHLQWQLGAKLARSDYDKWRDKANWSSWISPSRSEHD